MAQVARAQGDPLKLRSLSVQFRGIGVPEQEIVITSTDNGDGTVACEALQGEQRLVRRGRAVLTIR
jgi:hypothetical protein